MYTLNHRYGKALERRSKVLKKIASKLGGGDENIKKKIDHLTLSLEVSQALIGL